jgi:hypothetical protein
MAGGEACEVMVRGDCSHLDLEDGRTLHLPDGWGLLHDTIGRCTHRCDIFIVPYRCGRRRVDRGSDGVVKTATEYFGRAEELYEGTVEMPPGPWEPVGRVVTIYYDREGDQGGYYYHPFAEPVPLFEQRHGRAYKLALPRGCIVNRRGFVKP